MRIGDLPWLLVAGALVVVGGGVVWLSLFQLAAGDSGAVGVSLYLVGIGGGIALLACGLLGLALYVTRIRQ